jgi:hypothetical protein
LEQIGAGFYDAIYTDLSLVTASVVTYDRIDVAQFADDGVIDLESTYLIPVGSGGGADVADPLPPHDCYTYKYVAAGGTRRHGFKRFGGVTEGTQTKGLPTGGAMGLLNAIADDLGSTFSPKTIDPDTGLPLDDISGALLTPIIVHRVLNGDIMNPISVSAIAGVVFDKIGTQNTRKYGRGS